MVVRRALLQVVVHGHIRDQDRDRDYVLDLELDPVGGNLDHLRKAAVDNPVLVLEGSREIAEALAGEVCYTPHLPEDGQEGREDREADSNHLGVEEDRQTPVDVADREAEDSPAAGEGLHTEDTGVLQKGVSDCVMSVSGRDLRPCGWYGLYDIVSGSVNYRAQ